MTCTTEEETECTVRNHDHMRADTAEVTYVKISCEGGFVAGTFDDQGNNGQVSPQSLPTTA